MYILKYAGSVLHDPRTDAQISAGTLKEESGQSPTLSLTIQPTHPLWDSFNRDTVMLPNREVELFEVETSLVLFRGRVRAISMEFDGSKKLTCEGAMAYLNDTTVRPYKTYDTDEIECDINAPAEANKLFEWFIEQHNAHVMNACEKFIIGVNAGIDFGKLQRGTGTRPSTLKEMRDKLEKACGGWLRVRYDATGSIIDWLPDTGAAEATQRVELGSNLLDLDTQIDGKDIFTAIVPVGKTGKGEDEHKVNVSAETAYVPFGYAIQGDAVVDMTAVEKYGLIEKMMSYDLDKPQALADKAVADLAAGKLDDSIEVSAFDLHNLNEQTLPIDFLDRVFVKSEPHGIERYMICSGRTINLTNPAATQFKLGAITATLTRGGTSSQESAQESIAKRVTSLSNATRNITKDAATTTIKVAAVEEKAAAVEKKADAATEKIADVAATATAAAEKVETVAAKAEKAAEEVSHVATDAKNAKDAAKEAKTMATEANNKATEVKATVDDMANAFSHDEGGAHVGDKDGVHTTIDSHGMKLLKGSEELAKFEQSAVSLGGGVFNIVDGYNYGKDDTKVTAVFAQHLLFNSGGGFLVNAPVIRLEVQDRQNGRTAKGIGLSPAGFVSMDRTRQREELITFEDLAKLIKFTSWTTLQDDGVCRVRYCLRGGMMYLGCYLAAGYSTRTTTAQMPDNLLPAIEGYYPLGTQTGNNTAKIWIGAAGGGDGHIYFYNWSSGYATGIIPILPKSME